MKDVVETEAFNEATIVLEKKRLLWVKRFFFGQILALDKINKKKSHRSLMMISVL